MKLPVRFVSPTELVNCPQFRTCRILPLRHRPNRVAVSVQIPIRFVSPLHGGNTAPANTCSTCPFVSRIDPQAVMQQRFVAGGGTFVELWQAGSLTKKSPTKLLCVTPSSVN